MKNNIADFCGGFSDQKETAAEIKRVYEKYGYVMDPHTAVGSAVYQGFQKDSGSTLPVVIASTASPYKFARSVLTAIDPKYGDMDDFDLFDHLSELSGVKIPDAIEEIRTAPVLHDIVIHKEEMEEQVKKFLGI